MSAASAVRRSRWGRGGPGEWLLKVHAALVYLFLYAPIAVLVVFSFNTSRLGVNLSGFTLRWYAAVAKNDRILEAAWNSLVVAVVATLASTALGTLTAFAFARHRFAGKTLLEGLIYVPIILPEIIMGISLLVLFRSIGLRLGLLTVAIAHITFCMSFVFVVVRARLHDLDRNLERAAMDLGANEWQTFWKVTFPLVFPGILAGLLLAFTLSVDDVIVTFFTTGPGATTLPLQVYSMVKFGVSPEINALSTVMLAVSMSLIVLAERLQRRRIRRQL